jgi:membrane-bound lytic murein transglycosylase B
MRMIKIKRSIAFSALFLGFGLSGSVPSTSLAQAQESADFYSFVRSLGEKARLQGVSQRTVDSVIPTLSFNQTVINLDRAQPGGNRATRFPNLRLTVPNTWTLLASIGDGPNILSFEGFCNALSSNQVCQNR